MSKIHVFILSICLLFSKTSYAKWTFVIESTAGSKVYVEFDSIKTNERYVYFWQIINNSKRNKFGDLSSKVFYELDCKSLGMRGLKFNYYKKKSAKGNPSFSSSEPDKNWFYGNANSAQEVVANKVCNYSAEKYFSN